MKESEIFEFLTKLAPELDSYGKFLYFTRAEELQIQAIDGLEKIRARVESILRESQEAGFEDTSNKLKALSCQISSICAELQMYLHLKKDEMSEAWDCLIDSQDGLMWAMRAHPDFNTGLREHAARMDAMEKLLFPRMIFFSMGMQVTASECSICQCEYRDCPHIKGRIYNGKFCSRKLTDINLQEVSMVDNPADKRCRATTFGEEGKTRDVLTLRETESAEQDVPAKSDRSGG
jgi:hypothetical protein